MKRRKKTVLLYCARSEDASPVGFILQSKGYRVLRAGNPQTFHQALQSTVDCVLLLALQGREPSGFLAALRDVQLPILQLGVHKGVTGPVLSGTSTNMADAVYRLGVLTRGRRRHPLNRMEGELV